MREPTFEPARLELARMRIETPEAYDLAVRRATELSARTLRVERVGVWLLVREHPNELVLKHVYVMSKNMHADGEALSLADAPQYRRALEERKAIAADDALTDPRTSSLASSYLVPRGITSMLDAPLYINGRVVGVICHEHVGPKRTWTQSEIDFACTIADTAALICDQAHRMSLEQELRERATRNASAEHVDQLARVAAGVAHELANVLSAVALAADSLARSPDPHTRELAGGVVASVDLGKAIVSGLRTFGAEERTPAGKQSTADAVITRFRPLLDLLGRPLATLTYDLEPGVKLAIDDVLLEQIILNLVLNARDAIGLAGRAGTITIRVHDGAPRATLDVIDDGIGMSGDVRARATDAYFTTKSSGTGLGLSLVRDYVAEAGGTIVFPASPTGTIVRIELARAP